MKKIVSILVLASLFFSVASCDKIDDPHKPFTPVSGGKTVLIKDFTGARCVNCPEAADRVHELQHRLGDDKVFVLAVHAGYLANPMGNFPDFTTEEGTNWYNDHDSNPLFAVDHVYLSDGNALNVDQIDTPVSDGLAGVQSFGLEITNQYDEASRTIQTQTDITAAGDVEGDFYVTVCLVEDSLVGWQTVPGSVNHEYVFRNVFRGTLNGQDGEPFFKGKCLVNDEFVKRHEMTLDSICNPDQCYILTYVSDKTNQGDRILQTAMQKLK